MVVKCPHCGELAQNRPDIANLPVVCSKCRGRFTMPPFALQAASPEQEVAPTRIAGTMVGLVFSAMGFIGWLGVLGLIVYFHLVQKPNGEPWHDGFEKVFGYLLSVAVGIVGLLVNTALSLTGLVTSLLAMIGRKVNWMALSGITLGTLGLVIGLGIILWRAIAWGNFVGNL